MATKPLNCFLLFCREYRTIFAVTNPELNNAEVTSLLAKNWRTLDPKIKNMYKLRAKKNFEVRVLKNYLNEVLIELFRFTNNNFQ